MEKLKISPINRKGGSTTLAVQHYDNKNGIQPSRRSIPGATRAAAQSPPPPPLLAPLPSPLLGGSVGQSPRGPGGGGTSSSRDVSRKGSSQRRATGGRWHAVLASAAGNGWDSGQRPRSGIWRGLGVDGVRGARQRLARGGRGGCAALERELFDLGAALSRCGFGGCGGGGRGGAAVVDGGYGQGGGECVWSRGIMGSHGRSEVGLAGGGRWAAVGGCRWSSPGEILVPVLFGAGDGGARGCRDLSWKRHHGGVRLLRTALALKGNLRSVGSGDGGIFVSFSSLGASSRSRL
nr:glycine-rich cell wall structural protein 1.0-like [Aegilops tauschii subsp. strangulata]